MLYNVKTLILITQPDHISGLFKYCRPTKKTLSEHCVEGGATEKLALPIQLNNLFFDSIKL